MFNIDSDDLKVVNIVGSGDLGVEIDLTQLVSDIAATSSTYTPEQFPGLQIKFEEDLPLCNLFTSGKYTVVGAKSCEKLLTTQNRLITELGNLDILPDDFTDDEFGVRNIVCTYDLKVELDLNSVTLELGLENVEYEPEQSPFIIYKPESEGMTITIPANGRIMITGTTYKKDALTAVRQLSEKIGVER